MATPGQGSDGDERTEVDRHSGRSNRPPGPDGLPLLGNTIGFLRDPVGFYEHLGHDYDSDVVAYDVAGTTGYLLTHPDDVEQVLVREEDRFVKGRVTQESLGQVVDGGLLLSEGEAWARQRKALQPAFYRERIETYADTMVGTAASTADRWDDGEVVAVRDEMQELTLDVLARTLFGLDLSGRGAAIGDAARALLAKFDAGALSAYLPPWVPTPTNRRFARAVADLEGVVDDLVAERRGDTEGRDDLVSLLLSADDGLDDDAIRSNMVTFLIAGHETTALSLTYALYLLATNPGTQERLRAELDGLHGDPTAADLFDLDYLDRVVTESLRLYPPAYTLFREPTEPVEVGGYVLEPGATLSLAQFVIHRDGRWYDEPGEFRPDRWTDDFEADLPDYAYYPFGGGARHCIGMRFARMETKLALATILRRVAVEPTADTAVDPRLAITFQPGGPVPLRVRER